MELDIIKSLIPNCRAQNINPQKMTPITQAKVKNCISVRLIIFLLFLNIAQIGSAKKN